MNVLIVGGELVSTAVLVTSALCDVDMSDTCVLDNFVSEVVLNTPVLVCIIIEVIFDAISSKKKITTDNNQSRALI